MNSHKLGAEIRRRRKALGMTLEDLSDIENAGNLSKVERGQLGIRGDKLASIAQRLQCSVSDLYAAAEGKADGTPFGFRAVPVLTAEQFSAYTGQPMQADARLFIEARYSEHTYAAEINDPAVYPTFPRGTVVVIDPREMPIPSSWVAVRSNGHTQIRRYRFLGASPDGQPHWTAHPTNEDYPVLDSHTDGLELLGVVVEHRLRHRD